MPEGLFELSAFETPKQLDLERLLGALVRVDPSRTFRFRLFDEQEEADAWSGREVHEDGSETLRMGMTEEDVDRCDEPLYLVGYGMRTARPTERLRSVGYDNVEHDLRISTGTICDSEGDSVLVAELDAAPGHSGSPVVDRRGRLVGLYVGSTGNGIVDPDGVLRRVLRYSAIESALL